MTDQKKASPDQRDPSPVLDAERRRRMREAAVAAARAAPGEWVNHRKGSVFRHIAESSPAAVLALLDWLNEQEEAASWCAVQLRQVAAERDSLREKLAAAERGA